MKKLAAPAKLRGQLPQSHIQATLSNGKNSVSMK